MSKNLWTGHRFSQLNDYECRGSTSGRLKCPSRGGGLKESQAADWVSSFFTLPTGGPGKPTKAFVAHIEVDAQLCCCTGFTSASKHRASKNEAQE